LDEAYSITTSIEGKLAHLQETQQKLQIDSSGPVIEKLFEEVKQAGTQCTAKVSVIQGKMGGLHTNISTPIECLKGESPCLCWAPIGNGFPQG